MLSGKTAPVQQWCNRTMTATEAAGPFDALLSHDMHAVDQLIRDRLRSDVVLVNQLGGYIIGSGGKRLRPRLVLLAAGAAGYAGKQHILAAAIIEFIHTSTLLHDDVVDSSSMRRGRETANVVWGNEAAVLVGDFLYSRAFEMMVEVGSMRVMEILSSTTNTIAEGEVMQLMHVHDPDISEAQYFNVIRCKTARLFEAAAQIGAVLTGLPQDQEQAMASYGLHLGQAFQLVDDVLDYVASSEQLGKNLGDDLAEGKPTLPLILAMQRASAGDAALIREAVKSGGLEQLDRILAVVESTGAIDTVRQLAADEAAAARAALTGFAQNDYCTALSELADLAINRSY